MRLLALCLALTACGTEPVDTGIEDALEEPTATPTSAVRSRSAPLPFTVQVDEVVPLRYVLLRSLEAIQKDIARDACARNGLKLLPAPLPELKGHRYWLQDSADFTCSYAADGARVTVECGAIIVSEVICNA